MTLAEKRTLLLRNVQAPVGVRADGATIVVSQDAPVVEATPFFGGYMDDMLEDWGVVEEDTQQTDMPVGALS